MNGPHQEEYRSAMKIEIKNLILHKTWVLVDRPPAGTNVLKGIWKFKLKRLPDFTPYEFKARYCARGDLQIKGVDVLETYAPVVQWSTIHLLLTIVLFEGWTTRQVDYTNAFAQAELEHTVYVEPPPGFAIKSGKDKVLLLKTSLYGLADAPRNFYQKLRAGLVE